MKATLSIVQDMPIPGHELLCFFDADQVAKPHFFARMLPLFDAGDDVAMVLSAQCFGNLNRHSDIFNHSNLQFWEYMQPGYDAWGFISCTGALANSLHVHIVLHCTHLQVCSCGEPAHCCCICPPTTMLDNACQDVVY